MPTYQDICKLIAAKNLFESGVAPKEIARQAKVSQATISEWLSIAKARRRTK